MPQLVKATGKLNGCKDFDLFLKRMFRHAAKNLLVYFSNGPAAFCLNQAL